MSLYIPLVNGSRHEFSFKAQISDPDPITKIRTCYIDQNPSPKMSGLTFDNQNALNVYVTDMQNIKNGFVPTSVYPYKGVLIALRDDIGCQLIRFVPENSRWKFVEGKAVLPNPQWSHGVRSVVKSMFQKHAIGKSMGFMYDHTYVNESKGTLTFTALRQGALANSDQCTEIWKDLLEMKKLMEVIMTKDFSFTDTKPVDLMIFMVLFPATAPTTLDRAIVLSYIICHAPLFMGPSERFRFATTYHVLRETNTQQFDDEVNYLGIWGNLGKWWEKIKKGNNYQLKSLYAISESKSSKGLMPFIRRCYHHMSSREPQLSEFNMYDSYLIRLFPDAFSKAYYEVFKIRNSGFDTTKRLMENFKMGYPEPLDYSSNV